MFPICNMQPGLPQYEDCAEQEESSDDSDDSNGLDDLNTALQAIMADPSLSTRVIPDPPSISVLERIPVPESLLRPLRPRAIRKRKDDFRFEAARLSSFRNWLVSCIDPASLAAAGFYYTGKLDRVKCFVCRVVVSHWSVGRTARQVHQIWSPTCKFVRNEPCDNVPIGTDADEILPATSRDRITSGRYGLELSSKKYSRHMENANAYELSCLGLKKAEAPAYHRYITYASRLDTFQRWTATHIKVEELVEAGFFYSGSDERTICYQCGVKIDCWKPGDDIWRQHAYYSPYCYYLLVMRGCEYINNVRGQKFYETAAEAPIQIEVGSHVNPTSENETKEPTLVEKVADLKEKNEKLKNARLCRVCTERETSIIFLPCEHLVTCRYCYRAFARCMVCETEVKAVTRIYFT